MTLQPVRVVLEGLPGGGKSTIAARLSRDLDAPLIPEWVYDEAALRRFPTDPPFFLVNDDLKETVAASFTAGRVIMDRHYHGAVAFLTASSSDSSKIHLRMYEERVRSGRFHSADLVIVLDLPPGLSIDRQPRAARVEARFGEAAALAIMRSYYRSIPGAVVIDATNPLEDVYANVVRLCTSGTAHEP